MEYREYAPSPALRRVVRCYWSLRANVGDEFGTPEPALPDGSPELIFNLGDPFIAVRDDGTRTEQPLAMLVGQITGPLAVVPSGSIDLVAVRFEPAGAAVLSNEMSSITDSWWDLPTLSTALAHPDVSAVLHALHAALVESTARTLHTGDASTADLRCIDARLAALEHALTALVALRPAIDPDVDSAVRAILESHGTLSLDALAVSLGRSMRHLQRLFARCVGISPKQLARIRRFQRVFSAWRDDPRSLSRVAAECGYHDQSHLIRDFRDFAGRAPAEFLANQPEFTQLFLPTGRARATG